MEALLIVSVVGWVVAGLNLLCTYDKVPSADAH